MLGINTKPSLYRDFAMLSVLIVFILFLVSIWVSYETYQEHSRTVIKQLESEAVRIDRALIIEIERASYLLESIARQIGTDVGNQDTIAQLFASFSKTDYPKNSQFFWIDASQQIVLGSNGFLEKPVPVSDRDYVKKSITAPWQIKIGLPVLGRVTEKWVMPIAIGLTDNKGKFVGAVMISLDIGAFNAEVKNVIKQDGISFAVTNQSFTLLTEQSETPDFFSTNFDVKKLATLDFSKKPQGVYSQGSLFNRDRIFSYYETSSQYPYIIFVGYDTTLQASKVNKILFPRLLQIFIITMFLISILWTVRRRIIQPVISLTERTAAIVRGQTTSLAIEEGPDEIEQLTVEIQRLCAFIAECKRIESELRTKNGELLHIKQSAELSNHIKAEFFKEVGESLHEPISKIAEGITCMSEEQYGPIEQDDYLRLLKRMNREVLDAQGLLNDILSISRSESGLLSLKITKVDLPFVLQKCIRILHERTRFEEIEIIQNVEPKLPALLADEDRLNQLLLNLLMGSASHLKSSDTIRVYMGIHRQQCVIRMEYTIPEPEEPRHELSYIGNLPLEPEEDASQDMMPITRGLGLALSRLIVAMHGGSLDIKTKIDRSVTITVTLPEERLIRD